MSLLKRLLAVVLTACIVVSLAAAAGCGGGGQETAPQAQETIKIGGIFDITGGTGDVGSPYADGARACVDFLNSKGGINGRQIDLVWRDYAYDIKRATEIYHQLVQQEKVVAILGWGTGDTEDRHHLLLLHQLVIDFRRPLDVVHFRLVFRGAARHQPVPL